MLSRQSRILLDTLLPAGAHPDLKIGLLDAGFDEFWQDIQQTALPSLRWGFLAALFAANWVSPLLVRRLPPLALHGRPTRERALAAMENSRIPVLRQLMALLKTIVCFSYGANRDVRAAIGYPRQPGDPSAGVFHDI